MALLINFLKARKRMRSNKALSGTARSVQDFNGRSR